MGRRPSEAQWEVARQLTEIEPPTRTRIAAILGVAVTNIYKRAAAEGWRMPDFRNQELLGVYREAQLTAAAIAADKGRVFGTDADATAADGLAEPPETVGPHERQDAGEPLDDGAASAKAPALSDFDALDPIELLARATGFVARQLTRLMHNAERRGGRLDKAQIDGLVALSRMMDRWETLAQDRAKKEETESDADLSEALRWINERIIELAEGEAERIVAAAGVGAPGGETSAPGVVRPRAEYPVSAVVDEAGRA